jgi:hypothetical protein
MGLKFVAKAWEGMLFFIVKKEEEEERGMGLL